MQKTIMVIVAVVLAVSILGFWVMPWLVASVFGGRYSVTATVLTAEYDGNVNVPGTNATVERIATELEITFPYGEAPENVNDLNVRDDSEQTVEVDWGRAAPEKIDIEGRSMSKLMFKDVLFPTDFKQGKLLFKSKYLCYIKMIPVKNMPQR